MFYLQIIVYIDIIENKTKKGVLVVGADPCGSINLKINSQRGAEATSY